MHPKEKVHFQENKETPPKTIFNCNIDAPNLNSTNDLYLLSEHLSNFLEKIPLTIQSRLDKIKEHNPDSKLIENINSLNLNTLKFKITQDSPIINNYTPDTNIYDNSLFLLVDLPTHNVVIERLSPNLQNFIEKIIIDAFWDYIRYDQSLEFHRLNEKGFHNLDGYYYALAVNFSDHYVEKAANQRSGAVSDLIN